MSVISKTTRHGTYYTSYGSSEALTLSQMQVNANYIFKYCSELGISINAVCGMLGNFQVESSINPGRWQNDDVNNTSLGFGLCQWTPATKYLNELHPYGDGQPYEMDNNLYHICEGTSLATSQYITTSSYPLNYVEFLTSTKSPTYLAKAFLYNFERAGIEKVDLRVEYANYWYEFLTGSSPPIEPDNPTPTPSNPKKKKGFNFVLFGKRRRIYG